MENVNDTYFDGYYKNIWKAIIPDILTIKETDFIEKYFNLQPGSHVLDLMCGYGRHAFALASKGINVTAVDNLSDYINEIERKAKEENLPVKAIQCPVLEFKIPQKFDLVLCMGNSLNFFNEHDTTSILSNITAHLNEGGSLVINTWSLAEIAIKSFKEESSSTTDDMEYVVTSKYLFHPARIEADVSIKTAAGGIENKKAIDYIFSINEMETMINVAGLKIIEIFSIPGRKKFELGDPRAYIIARKEIDNSIPKDQPNRSSFNI